VLRGLATLPVMATALFAGAPAERLRVDARREDAVRRYTQVLRQYRDQPIRSGKAAER